MSATNRLLITLLLLSAATPLRADEDDVPYWASIQVSVVNMRVGPAITYPIDWVYKRELLPLKVVRKKEGWRLVEDPDGVRGWVLGRFLSRKRTAYVRGQDLAEMRDKPGQGSRLLWHVEPGVVGTLGECTGGWCEFTAGAHKGVVLQDRLWGTGEP